MHEQILELLKANGPAQIAQAIQQDQASAEIAKRYEQLVLDLYWKAKNLPAVIKIANMGLMYCLTNARKSADTTASDVLFDSAKKIAYNLASFCWPGWDEPGIEIGFADIRAGADAARLNLRLAEQLKRPPLGMSMAHWMLGGYAMAQRNFKEAIKQYTTAVDFSKQTEDNGNILSNEGFRALAELGLGDKNARQELQRVLDQLESLNTDDAKEYTRQIHAARKVFHL